MDLIQGLATRAESLLEKIDGQAARTAEDLKDGREWEKEVQKVTNRLQNASRYVSRSVTPVSERSASSRVKEVDEAQAQLDREEDQAVDSSVDDGEEFHDEEEELMMLNDAEELQDRRDSLEYTELVHGGSEATTPPLPISVRGRGVSLQSASSRNEEVASVTSKTSIKTSESKSKKTKSSKKTTKSEKSSGSSSQSRRIEALERELDIMDRQLVRMQEDLDAAQDALVKSQKQAGTREQKLKKQLREMEDRANEREDELLEALEASQKKQQELEKENKELITNAENFDEEYAELQELHDSLADQLQKTKKQLAAATQSRQIGVEELERELQLAQNNMEQSRREFAAQLHEAEKRIAELEHLNSELSLEMANQQRKFEEREELHLLQTQEAAYGTSEDHQQELYDAQEAQRQAEEALVQERRRTILVQQELDTVKGELERAQTRFDQLETRRKEERDHSQGEILQLKEQLETIRRRDDIQGVAALEQRLGALSEHLVAKQKQIELLTSEKGALRQRLKNLEKQYQDLQNLSQGVLLNNQSIDVESGSQQQSVSLRYRRRQEAAARRIARLGPIAQYENLAVTVDAVDQMCLSLGSVLYQQPWARLGFLFYLFLIHIWVLYIIAFHTHEAGPVSSSPKLPPGMQSATILK